MSQNLILYKFLQLRSQDLCARLSDRFRSRNTRRVAGKSNVRSGFVAPAVLVAMIALTGVAGAFQLTPKPRDIYEVKEGKIYYRHGNAGIIVDPATPEEVVNYYRERGSDIGNPFAKLGGDLKTATVFIVTLINRTNGSLTFNPRYVIAKVKTEAYFSLDIMVLMELFEGQDQKVKKLAKNI